MVTVIIPCYNRPEDLRNALNSLAAQTNKEFSVLVSDDASTEDTESIAKSFENILDITYIKKEKNGGIGANRQTALEKVFELNPEYIMWLDSDDSLMPNAIQRLLLAIQNNKADIIATDILCESNMPNQKIIKADSSVTWLHGKIYRTEYLKNIGIKFPQVSTNEDLGFNLVAFGKTNEIWYLNEIFYLWRNNENSITRSKAMTEHQRRCGSTDYIETLYFAFNNLEKFKPNVVGSIIHLYNYYERGLIYKTIEPKHEKMLQRMLHNRQILDTIVALNEYQGKLELDQWVTMGSNMIFFPHSYGTWISKFITKEEIETAIRRRRKK